MVQLRYHPICTVTAQTMISVSEADLWSQRLTLQLRALSELSETLTVRLLDMEERVVRCEDQLRSVEGRSRDAADGSAAVVDLLEQTEARIAHLEGLLEPGPRMVPEDRGRAPFHGAEPSESGFWVAGSGEPMSQEPFPDEGEQPFMDELIA